tara:strand:- start:343 stop:756 length:414 start_codon:yes stop_codon:yes gene_type:complete
VTEDEFQKLVVQWLDAALPTGCFFHHSPNEGRRHVNYMMRLKRLGMKSGFPDLCIFVPHRYFWGGIPYPLFIELKAPKRGVVTPAQKAVQAELGEAGCMVLTANRLHKVKAWLSHIIELRENGKSRAIEKMAEVQGA